MRASKRISIALENVVEYYLPEIYKRPRVYTYRGLYSLDYCCSLVGDFKLSWDWRWRELTQNFRGDGWGAVNISDFFQVVLPFSQPLEGYAKDVASRYEENIQEIDARQIVPQERQAYLFDSHDRDRNLLTENAARADEDEEKIIPHVERIGNLNLYCAANHGNFLALVRRHNARVRCRVLSGKFPESNKLKILSLGNKTFLLMCNDEAKIILFPDVAIPLLLAYGVSLSQINRCTFWKCARRKKHDFTAFFPSVVKRRSLRHFVANREDYPRIGEFLSVPQPCGE